MPVKTGTETPTCSTCDKGVAGKASVLRAMPHVIPTILPLCVQYSFYSEKHRRYEMAVLELYEGKEQSNSTAFSSFSPPANPLVLRQSYIFPVPINRMASTVTEKGITNKNLICTYRTGLWYGCCLFSWDFVIVFLGPSEKCSSRG